ncbi:NAD(P)-dependent alcohol dehydrogenase [Paracoccus aestuariivivens]|uniref:Alcohol dehydrogenase catalytic domain-containing protein n=1 Tax=Paracoccus aestuariivivens TaxID=1820333 RepID=A0A6L6JIL0_9RHOB|nr:NAD(P)-dependent alcohol dehydrogenase [Paracoccus aestuariivivens]MTH79711.1 alcohol dehydrogenase catalytic domain-containing protein [Paracoccus aestuariivivens]
MQSLVLERQGELSLRDFPAIDHDEETLGPRDVRIRLHTVGICGSDVHYYTHGRIGPFVVNAPMILGHEASGTVIETGSDVSTLKPGDRVCMEPGIPEPNSRATRLGMYNVDPAVRFWATPPVHGILRPTCVHPEAFTFKLPDTVSFAEAAMVEPLAVGIHAATKARIKPGDNAVVMGAGPIGLVTALSALAAGCARVFLSDVAQPKLDIGAGLSRAIIPVNVAQDDLAKCVLRETDGWGADVVFEATGSPKAAAGIFQPLAPGGCVVMIGGQPDPIAYDAGAAMVREARVENIFRYAHAFPRCVNMIASGAIDVKPLITRTFAFSDSVQAFEIAASAPASDVKMQIEMPQ